MDVIVGIDGAVHDLRHGGLVLTTPDAAEPRLANRVLPTAISGTPARGGILVVAPPNRSFRSRGRRRHLVATVPDLSCLVDDSSAAAVSTPGLVYNRAHAKFLPSPSRRHSKLQREIFSTASDNTRNNVDEPPQRSSKTQCQKGESLKNTSQLRAPAVRKSESRPSSRHSPAPGCGVSPALRRPSTEHRFCVIPIYELRLSSFHHSLRLSQRLFMPSRRADM